MAVSDRSHERSAAGQSRLSGGTRHSTSTPRTDRPRTHLTILTLHLTPLPHQPLPVTTCRAVSRFAHPPLPRVGLHVHVLARDGACGGARMRMRWDGWVLTWYGRVAVDATRVAWLWLSCPGACGSAVASVGSCSVGGGSCFRCFQLLVFLFLGRCPWSPCVCLACHAVRVLVHLLCVVGYGW